MIILGTSDSALREWVGRAILHVDLDAFFAAAEQLDHAEWRGLPVIVGGSPERRGVVATASYEARRFGVRSAMSSARAASLCPDAIWAPARFDRYRELSEAVFDVLRTECPRVQVVSIDEAFLDVTCGRWSSEHPVEIAVRIRSRVAELGLTVSIGVATSKTVSKIASDHDKPDGLTIVWPGEEAAFLGALPVAVMSGIGPRSAERLVSLGVSTLGDLARLDATTARSVLGSHGEALVQRALGVDTRPVTDRDSVKSVSNERTFATDVRAPDEVRDALRELCARVASRLRKKRLTGRTITVKLRFSDFTTRTVTRSLPVATDDEASLEAVAWELLRQAWSAGVGLRLLGVGVSGFGGRAQQLDLLCEDDSDGRMDRRNLMTGVDAIRERFGADAVRFGSQVRSRDDREDS